MCFCRLLVPTPPSESWSSTFAVVISRHYLFLIFLFSAFSSFSSNFLSLLPSVIVFLYSAILSFFSSSSFDFPLSYKSFPHSRRCRPHLSSFSPLFNLYPFTDPSSCSFWGQALHLFLALWMRRKRVALTHPPTLIISLRWLSEHTAITKAAPPLLLPTYIWICMHP